MFRLVYQNKIVGVSKLESGDPSIGCVSGALLEAGSLGEFTQWMMDNGGATEDGAYMLPLDRSFLVLQGDATPLPFAEGSIICVPDDNEAFLEILGVPAPEYAHFFPAHLASFEQDAAE